MSTTWTKLSREHFLSLAPWCWVQLESAEPPGLFPFVGGLAPDVVAALQEAHSLLASAIDTAISDVSSKRAPVDAPDRQQRLQDANAVGIDVKATVENVRRAVAGVRGQ